MRCCHISFCTHFVCPKSHESIDVWCLLPLTLLCVVFDITSKQNDLSKRTNANKMKKNNNKNSHAYVNNTGIFAHTHTYWLIVCKPLLVYSRCAKYSIDFVCYRSPNAVVELSIFHVCLSFTWYRIQFDEKCISHIFNDIQTKWPNTQICNITFYQMHIYAFQRKYCMSLEWILMSLLSCEIIFLSNLQHILYFHSVLTAFFYIQTFSSTAPDQLFNKRFFFFLKKKIKIKDRNSFRKLHEKWFNFRYSLELIK